jgi:putative permease
MTKKIAWTGIAVMTTLLALAAMWQFRTVVLIALVSLAFAATVRPMTRRRARQKFIGRLALTLLFVLVIGGVGFLFVWVGGAVIGDIRQLANSVAVQDAWVLPDWLPDGGLGDLLPPPSQFFAALVGDQGQFVLPTLLGLTQGIAGLISSLLIILLLSLYWSMNQVHFERLWLSLLPPEGRKRARNTWRTVEADLGAYIRSQFIQSLLAGLILGLGYWVLGSPYPALLGAAGALAWLIPMVGVGLAVFLPLSIGLLTSVQTGLLTAGYTVVVLIALDVWVKPRLFNHRQYNPILTVVILIALADAFGFIGIIAAPPLSAAIQILWTHLVTQRSVSQPLSNISDLKERQLLLWEAIGAMDAPPPLVTSSMERLTSLMEKAEPVLQEFLPVEPPGLHSS